MWTESRGRLPTYLLVGRSGPNVVHACKFFFFFLSEYKIRLPGGRRILAHDFRGLGFWGFGSCFQRTKGSGSWLMFSEIQDFWILAHVFRGPRVFWALAHVFRGPKVLDPSSCFQRPRILDLGSCFQRTKGFLGFGSCFQKTKGSGSWLMFSKAQDFWILAHVFRGPRVFCALAHVFRGPKVLDPDSCFQRPRILDLGSCFQRTKGFLGFGSCFQRTKGLGS